MCLCVFSKQDENKKIPFLYCYFIKKCMVFDLTKLSSCKLQRKDKYLYSSVKYLHFSCNPLINLLIFATVHSLMNYINLIDSCQADLPVQYASNIQLISQKWYWCCDWQRATTEPSLLFAQLAVCVQAGCSTFPFYTPTKPLIQFLF